MAEFTGERVIPGQVDPDLWNEHFARYAFASRISRRRRVLDIGCGTGYGSAELARAAISVTAADLSADAVSYGRTHYPGVQFLQASAANLPLRDGSFDLVVAFEVIEHLADWNLLLHEMRRLLAPGGQVILSTPNKSYYAESRKLTGPNPFHTHEFTFAEFRDALLAVFPHVSLFLQNHAAGIVFEPLPRAQGADVRIEGAGADPADSHFYLAVCALTHQTGAPTFVFLPTSANVLRERELHIERLEGELETKNAWLDEARTEHQALVAQFRAQTLELERRNEWARRLDEEVQARRERIVQLQDELTATKAAYDERIAQLSREADLAQSLAVQLDAKVAELAQCVDALHTTESELDARTAWARTLDVQVQELSHQLDMVAQSRWMKFGRTLGLGPVLREP